MPLAKKCSRCGKLYEHYPKGKKTEYNGIKRIMTDKTNLIDKETKGIDLCPECMSEFNRWMIEGGKFDD